VLFNTFPIERRGGSLSSTPGYLLKDGWSIVVYPEGTRSRDGWTGQFKLGAAFMAISAGVPVVPIAIRGTFNAMPHEQTWPSPGRPPVSIRYGDPVTARPGEGPRDFTRRIQAAMAGLLEEDSSDWYSSRLRASGRATPRRAARGGALAPGVGDQPGAGASRPQDRSGASRPPGRRALAAARCWPP
jgi:1-acyl-sn-glycerol-3-phosphate acyltransferase